MLAFFFLKLNSKRLYQSSGKEKESHCLEFTSSITRGISRRCRAVTAKQCTKKRDARADLFFFFGQSKPIPFLKFSLTSPSSLLKVPIYSYCFQRMKIIVSVLVRVQQTSLGLARGEQSHDNHHLSFICVIVIIQMKTT